MILVHKRSFLKDIRELALKHHKEEIRHALKLWADKAEIILKEFENIPSRNNLIELIGIWNRAIMFYDRVVINDTPNGGGCHMPVPKPSEKIEVRKAAGGTK